jgi:hypothetical protein
MNSYARAKFVVETNARGQALNDSQDLPIHKVIEYVSDPRVVIDAREMLTFWSYGNTTDIVFTQLDKEDYQNLTDEQRRQLVAYWCNYYLELMMKNLKQRLEKR